MKIIDNRAVEKHPNFDDIEVGYVFRADGIYYMKTADCDNNAVNLYNGSLQSFGWFAEVEPVDCELVIK